VLAFLSTPPLQHSVRLPARQPAALMQQGSFMGKVKQLNEMNKAKVVKKERPKVGGKRLPPSMVEVTSRFKKQYEKKDLEVLWGALLKIYGSAPLAEQAVKENPQILNPSYSFCNTMLASNEVLVDMMGKEDALDVMLKNPAVLQCGPSLDTLGPDEIKGFANLRSLGNRLFPEEVRGYALTLLILFCLFPVLGTNSEVFKDSPLLNIAKPLVGILFAVVIEGSRIVIVGSIVKAKVAGDEKSKQAVEKAKAAERRRMGLAK